MVTHDIQSVISSFTLFLSFVTNSTMDEKAFSDSTHADLFVSKAWYSVSNLTGLLL